jgi:hypothetical protein
MRSMILIAVIATGLYGFTTAPAQSHKHDSLDVQFLFNPRSNLPPTQIVDFTVRRLSRKVVLVSWHTEKGGDSDFEIERKNGFQGVFIPVGFVPSKASGNDSQLLDYSFSDNNIFDGASYYRIVQKDAKGRGYYTMIKATERE